MHILQSGRVGKLNKRVTFPETLYLRPYMSEPGDGNDIYKFYAVVVHVACLMHRFSAITFVMQRISVETGTGLTTVRYEFCHLSPFVRVCLF